MQNKKLKSQTEFSQMKNKRINSTIPILRLFYLDLRPPSYYFEYLIYPRKFWFGSLKEPFFHQSLESSPVQKSSNQQNDFKHKNTALETIQKLKSKKELCSDTFFIRLIALNKKTFMVVPKWLEIKKEFKQEDSFK